MKLTVVDTETNDLNDADVVEAAFVSVLTGPRIIGQRFASFVNTTKPVHPKARAAHHITDEEIAAAPSFSDVMYMAERVVMGTEYFVAHNAEFDLQFFPEDWRFICTKRCAQHLWPDAPGYGNQVLRYWLGVGGPRSRLPPHRALPDAEVTALLLLRMLTTHTPEELYALTQAPIIHTICTMTKHKGKTWAEVLREDRAYMRWIRGQGEERVDPRTGDKKGFDRDMLATMDHYLNGGGASG